MCSSSSSRRRWAAAAAAAAVLEGHLLELLGELFVAAAGSFRNSPGQRRFGLTGLNPRRQWRSRMPGTCPCQGGPMKAKYVLAGIVVLALLYGTALYLNSR